jgi:uncharacterized protein (TIGR03083 family)
MKEDIVTQSESRSVNAMEFAGKGALLEALRTDRSTFSSLVGRLEDDWNKQTPCEAWQLRDLVGHLVDNTEAYLERFDGARTGREFPDPVGLLVMAEMEDAGARRFRDLPREELLKRWNDGADRLFAIFDKLDEQEWNNHLVNHIYMGPLPAFFFPVFQLMDYSVHTWDAQRCLGQEQPLTELSADLLTPFMFILLQYTVDAERAANKKLSCGIKVSGRNGGSWLVTVDNGDFSYQADPLTDAPATLSFNASEFVLTCFQRIQGGQDSGDPETARTFRSLFFKI